MNELILDAEARGLTVHDWSVTRGYARVTVGIGRRFFYMGTSCEDTLGNWLDRKVESANRKAKGK